MTKKNQEGEAALLSSEESDSDATSSSSEEEGSPSTTADKKSAAQKKPPEPAAEKTGDSGSESDDSDSDSPVKPIASKQIDDGSKLRKPRSKPNSKPKSAASTRKTPAKRVAVAEEEKDSKKSKTEKGGAGEEEAKKSVLFQRLWSDDDEIVILKGMLDYKENKGADPMTDANAFHDFIRKSLHVDVDRRQTVSKVRRLKKRYENSLGKRKTLNPHEKNVLDLARKIWGNHMESADLDQQSKSNMKTRTISKAAAATKSDGNAGMTSPARNGSEVNYDGKKEAGNSGDGVGSSGQFIGKASISMGLDESIVKVGLELCNEDRKAQIEEKWRKLHFEESDLFLRKLDLVRQESEMIIAAIRSGGN